MEIYHPSFRALHRNNNVKIFKGKKQKKNNNNNNNKTKNSKTKEDFDTLMSLAIDIDDRNFVDWRLPRRARQEHF